MAALTGDLETILMPFAITQMTFDDWRNVNARIVHDMLVCSDGSSSQYPSQTTASTSSVNIQTITMG